MKNDFKIIEAHMHVLMEMPADDTVSVIKEYLKQLGYERVALLSLPYVAGSEEELLTQNINTIYCKKRLDGKAYAFGALIHHFDEHDTGEGYLNQAKELMKQGFDGIKMFEGKPLLRKRLGKRLDDSVLDLLYGYCEAEEIPLIFHLADPPFFWDINKIDEAFIKNGWFCDETYPSKQELHCEMEGILKKFPRLHITIAHLSFLSDDISYASQLLDKYGGLCYDLAPNPYEFLDFEEKHDEWREFFIKYSDRIIYGTDSYNIKKPLYTRNKLRAFLETDEIITVENKAVRGFKLPLEALENIYYNSFIKTIKMRREVDGRAVLSCAEKLLPLVKNKKDTLENVKSIISYLGD